MAVVAESSKPKRGPRVLTHLEIHPKLGGGHVVKHVYSDYNHESKSVNFGKNQGQQMLAHVSRHSGITSGTPNQAEKAE